jgi:MFS family permease
MIGAIIAIWLMKHGRRITLYATTCCSAVCIFLLVIENQWIILLGRFLLGFPMAFLAVSTARFLEEFTPMHLFGPVLTMMGFLTNGIVALTMIIASLGMPDSNDIEGLKTT